MHLMPACRNLTCRIIWRYLSCFRLRPAAVYGSSARSLFSQNSSVTRSSDVDNLDANIFSPRKIHLFANIPNSIDVLNSGGATPADFNARDKGKNTRGATEKEKKKMTPDDDDDSTVTNKFDVVNGSGSTNESNDSFAFKQYFMQTPKSTFLMKQHRASSGVGKTTVFTYQEDIGILDSQSTFGSFIGNAHDMYDLPTGVTGMPTVVDRSSILDKLANVSNVIQFRVFCYAFRNASVGTEEDLAQSAKIIISACLTAFQWIKMLHRDSLTNN